MSDIAPTNPQEIANLYKNDPLKALTMFPNGCHYTISDDESLASLGEMFNLDWKEIAQCTMGTSNPNEINEWLSKNGGQKLKSGYWAFSKGQVIKIPTPKI